MESTEKTPYSCCQHSDFAILSPGWSFPHRKGLFWTDAALLWVAPMRRTPAQNRMLSIEMRLAILSRHAFRTPLWFDNFKHGVQTIAATAANPGTGRSAFALFAAETVHLVDVTHSCKDKGEDVVFCSTKLYRYCLWERSQTCIWRHWRKLGPSDNVQRRFAAQ